MEKPKSKSKKNMCSLCKTYLYKTSYSNHYCRENIPIQSTGIIKSLLKKSSSVRQKYPNVQHVWADLNPKASNSDEYLVKIKAPLEEIDDFIADLKIEIETHKQTLKPETINHNNFVKPTLICSFYNSPDGCQNEHCTRQHIDDPEERANALTPFRSGLDIAPAFTVTLVKPAAPVPPTPAAIDADSEES